MTFLVLQAGVPLPSLRRHHGFPHWIRVAAGLAMDDAVAVDVVAEAPPDPDGFAGVIVTGSGAMVSHRHDWSERAAAWLRDAASAGLPLFGICFGHQLLAHALGGRVDDHPGGREMGTVDIEVLPAASDDPLFGAMPPRFAAHATHLQTVLEPPPGATVLARTPHDACQAFRWGDVAWGVQFHPEFSVAHMRGYVQGRRDALLAEGRDPRAMSRTITATPHARRLLRRFVDVARAH